MYKLISDTFYVYFFKKLTFFTNLYENLYQPKDFP